MYALTEQQYQAEAEPILRQVFVTNDPFANEFFTLNIQARRIIYPCEDEVESPLIDAIIATATNFGDTGCYISVLYQSPNRSSHCYIPFSEFSAAYMAIRFS